MERILTKIDFSEFLMKIKEKTKEENEDLKIIINKTERNENEIKAMLDNILTNTVYILSNKSKPSLEGYISCLRNDLINIKKKLE